MKNIVHPVITQLASRTRENFAGHECKSDEVLPSLWMLRIAIYCITAAGRKALLQYLDQMQAVIDSVRDEES